MTTTVASTWDIAVVSAMNAASVISYIPRWQSIEFSDQLNDYGSGRLVHDFADPFFAQFEADNGFPLLTGPYALKIFRNGSPVFTFLIEDVQVERLPDGQTVTISGRGIGAALEWAIALPEGYSGQARVGTVDGSYPKLWDRDFIGYKWICRVATTTNLVANYSNGPMTTYPGSGAYLFSTTNTALPAIDGISDLIVGDIILVKNQTNAAHNGIYYVADLGGATVWRLTRIGDADAPVNLTVGSQAFVTEGATNGYKIYNLSSIGGMTLPTDVGTSLLTFTNTTTGGINALSAFWILFKEAQTGYEYATAPAEFGVQRTVAGRGGPNYAVDWPLFLDGVVDANKGFLDSKGQVIQDAGRFTVPQGKHMGEVLKQVVDQTGLAWKFHSSGSVSFVVAPFSRQGVVNSVPFGTDRTTGATALLFSLPSMQMSETKSSVADRRTVTYGSDQRGVDKVLSASATLNTYGIRESWFENSAQDASAIINFTTNAMRKIDGAKLSQTASFPEFTGQTAWVDFFVGDKVLVETAIGLYSQLIIGAISASITSTNDQTIEVTFGQVFPDIASDLTTQGGFGSHNASIIAGFTGQTPNVNLPAPVSASVVTGAVGMSNRVTVTWDNTGSKAAQYEVAVFREGTYVTGVSLTRTGNLGAGTKASHGFTNGMFVNIYPDTALSVNAGFASFNVPLLNTSGSEIYWANQGPNISASVSASVAQVLEYSTMIVDGSQNSATIENLSSPGSTYSYIVTPINELGLKSTKTIKSSFVSSNQPFQLVSSAVQSLSFVDGVSGWRISGDGTAQFNGSTFAVSTIDIGGADTTSFHVDAGGNMWSGAAASVSAPFRVTSSGVMTATSGTFSGTLSSTSGTIGNWTLGADTLTSADGSIKFASVTGASFIKCALDLSTYTTINSDGSINMYNGSFGSSMTLNGATIQVVDSLGRNTSIQGSGIYNNLGTIISDSDFNLSGKYLYAGRAYLTSIRPTLGLTSIDCTENGFTYYASQLDPYVTAGKFPIAIAYRLSGARYYIVANNDGTTIGQITVTVFSDRRLKNDISPVSKDILDKFYSLNVHKFNWNEKAPEYLDKTVPAVGVIADELKEIFPDAVDDFYSEEGLVYRYADHPEGFTREEMVLYGENPYYIFTKEGVYKKPKYATVDYTKLVPYLLAAVKDLNNRVIELENAAKV